MVRAQRNQRRVRAEITPDARRVVRVRGASGRPNSEAEFGAEFGSNSGLPPGSDAGDDASVDLAKAVLDEADFVVAQNLGS